MFSCTLVGGSETEQIKYSDHIPRHLTGYDTSPSTTEQHGSS